MACAYCKLPKSPTREHVVPDWIYEAKPEWTMIWLGRVGKLVGADPTPKDTCEDCNSGPLSVLDSYSKALWDKYLSKNVASNDIVEFEYDFDLLARWLLKVGYNAARANGSPDTLALSLLTPYILGEGFRPVGLAVLIRVIAPCKAPLHSIRQEMMPDVLRIDDLTETIGNTELCVCRRVVIMSYEFWVVVPNSLDAKINMSREVTSGNHIALRDNTVALSRSLGKVRLRPSSATVIDVMGQFVATHPNLANSIPERKGKKSKRKSKR